MAQIDYYFSTMSPFTYLAGTRLEEIVGRNGASIVYRPVDIMALFSRTGGQLPQERHPNRQAYRVQDLARSAAIAGLDINLRPAHFPTNAAPSSYAIIAAQSKGGGDLGRLVHAILRAVWVEEKDIADEAVIRDALESAGFDPSLAQSGLLEGAEAYGRNLENAVAAGVFGSPFYITDDDQRFWGHDRLDHLDWYLGRHG